MNDIGDAERVARDPEFAPDERLFRRVRTALIVDNHIDDIELPSPSFSVNREKYSRPREVLLGLEGYKVAAFMVEALPVATEFEGATYGMFVEHEPDNDTGNYAHCGVHTARDGTRLSAKPSKIIRKKLRDLLRRGIEVLNDDQLD